MHCCLSPWGRLWAGWLCRARIPGIDVALKDGETYQFGAAQMHVFDTPGHTRGHITLWFPGDKVLFPGECCCALWHPGGTALCSLHVCGV